MQLFTHPMHYACFISLAANPYLPGARGANLFFVTVMRKYAGKYEQNAKFTFLHGVTE